jgi:hypothetical protein
MSMSNALQLLTHDQATEVSPRLGISIHPCIASGSCSSLIGNDDSCSVGSIGGKSASQQYVCHKLRQIRLHASSISGNLTIKGLEIQKRLKNDSPWPLPIDHLVLFMLF